jgi:hypothetical protein
MGKHDTCQNSQHSFPLTPAAATITIKISANTLSQRLYWRQKLNWMLTAAYKYCSYLITCLVYLSQLNYFHLGNQTFDEDTHASTTRSNIIIMYLIVMILHSSSQTLWNKKWAHLYFLQIVRLQHTSLHRDLQ